MTNYHKLIIKQLPFVIFCPGGQKSRDWTGFLSQGLTGQEPQCGHPGLLLEAGTIHLQVHPGCWHDSLPWDQDQGPR